MGFILLLLVIVATYFLLRYAFPFGGLSLLAGALIISPVMILPLILLAQVLGIDGAGWIALEAAAIFILLPIGFLLLLVSLLFPPQSARYSSTVESDDDHATHDHHTSL